MLRSFFSPTGEPSGSAPPSTSSPLPASAAAAATAARSAVQSASASALALLRAPEPLQRGVDPSNMSVGGLRQALEDERMRSATAKKLALELSQQLAAAKEAHKREVDL